jgi:hypothetical protein
MKIIELIEQLEQFRQIFGDDIEVCLYNYSCGHYIGLDSVNSMKDEPSSCTEWEQEVSGEHIINQFIGIM